jgi:hypothetical protein
LLHVLGIGLVPDSLLMFFTVLLMGQTLRLMQSDGLACRGDWLLWGCLLGLAGLSKYTAIFMALASGLCLLSVHGLRILRTPWPWLAVLLALLMVSPVLVWNAQQDWISFRYQGQHGAGSGWHLAEVARFALLQLLAFGPLLLWGLSGHSKQGALRLFFALPWLVLAYLAGGGSSLPHWTAPAWVALAPFAGVALARFAYGHGDRGRQRLGAAFFPAPGPPHPLNYRRSRAVVGPDRGLQLGDSPLCHDATGRRRRRPPLRPATHRRCRTIPQW